MKTLRSERILLSVEHLYERGGVDGGWLARASLFSTQVYRISMALFDIAEDSAP